MTLYRVNLCRTIRELYVAGVEPDSPLAAEEAALEDGADAAHDPQGIYEDTLEVIDVQEVTPVTRRAAA